MKGDDDPSGAIVDLTAAGSEAVDLTAPGARPELPPDGGGSQPSPLELMTRPLLELMRVITGLETTFITHIDWSAQSQEVVHALNSGELVVAEGSVVDWSDSMCRRTFLSGREQTDDVAGDFPDSLGATRLGMRTFMAVPIVAEQRTIGTVCGASKRVVEIDERVLYMMRLVADSMAAQPATERESRDHQQRADVAERLALTDAGTGLPNRRAFSCRWEEELAASGRHRYPISLLLVDVDQFKEVNDTYGHEVGDRVLEQLATALSSVARTEDTAARLGGDEFALAAVHTDAHGAERLAGRLRTAFERRVRSLGVPCTISVGVSCSVATPRDDMLAAADIALYRAKNAGRDQVAIWAGGPVERRPLAPGPPEA